MDQQENEDEEDNARYARIYLSIFPPKRPKTKPFPEEKYQDEKTKRYLSLND
jgi:hypothetical protein